MAEATTRAARVPRAAPAVVAEPERFARPEPLGAAPFRQIRSFLKPDAAAALRRELLDGVQYERVELAHVNRMWRGARPVGDAYFGELIRAPGWSSSPEALEALALFEAPWFLELLSTLMGAPACFLRPATPYRLTRGDKVCLHDDMSSPEHLVSTVLNLSEGWRPEQGGCTVVGAVDHVEALASHPEAPFPLREWHVAPNAAKLLPTYNSLLVLPLSEAVAHGVEEVFGEEPRLSLVAIYGRADVATC